MATTAGYWSTWVFDCDGVIFDSNRIKAEAMRQAALQYGDEAAERLLQYHHQQGGVSREKKFHWFFSEVVQIPVSQREQAVEHLKQAYATRLWDRYVTSAEAPGLRQLLVFLQQQGIRCMVASGGDEQELHRLFRERGLFDYFDAGIWGSPTAKDVILQRELANGNLTKPALYLGDSQFDWQAANNAGLDFVFLSAWSDVSDALSWCQQHGIRYCADVLDAASALLPEFRL